MSHTFTLPIRQPDASETVLFRVDWGDGSSEVFVFDGNTWSTQDFSHYYSNDNLKTIKIYPPLGEKFGKYWGFGHANATNSAAQMSHITKWGGFEFSSAGGSFKNCVNLDIDSNLTGTPAINYPNSLHSAFSGCTAFSPEPNQLINWDTSAAETLYETFYGCSNFNSSVSNWNVSNVTNTTRMFADCVAFNQSFGGWNSSSSNTGNLVTATAMFRGASSFNQSLSDWNVSKLVWIEQMFKNATNFASQIFSNFDANGGSASLQEVFMGTKFDGVNITTWDVSNIMFFGGVFEDNAHFNQDIGDWDVGGAVGGFSNMFKGATSFNKDISEWDTSSASNFSGMFQGASSFNQNINTKPAITKHGATYNPWTIKTSSGPNNLDNMLHGAAAFDQDISDWNMTHISSADNLLEGTDLSAANAAAINDSGTGWPSQSGVDSDAVAASQAAQQASGTVPVITSHTAGGGNVISNPENTQTVVNFVAVGSPTPTLSLSNNSVSVIDVGDAIDKDKFTLVDNGDGTGTLKLTNAPDFESPTDDAWSGQNTYAVYVHATNAIGSTNAFFNFNVTDVAETVAPTWVNRGSGSTVTQLIDQSSNPNQWTTYYDNDENTIETVYFEAAGTPTPSFSIKTGTGAYDGDMFTLVDHGNGTGLIKLTNPIDYENRPYNYGYGTGHYSAVVVAENTHNGNNTTIETIFTVFPKNVSDVVAPAVTSQPTTNLTSTSFFINWSSVGSDVRYTYEFASDSGFNSILKQDNDYGGIYVTTSGAGLTLNPETTYYFRVKANGGGVGSTYEVDGPWTTWSIDTAATFHSAHLIGAGHGTSLFRKSDDSLWGVGRNDFGQLGDGTTEDSLSPVQISSSSGTQFSGAKHTVFQKTSFSLWAMGRNTYGQLGDGSTSHRSSPVEIVSSGVISMAVGYEHTIFSKSDGSLWAMGYNYNGQLGDGTSGNGTNKNVPTQILASGVTQVFGGGSHSFFLKDDGSLWGMGANHYGQLGVAGGGTQTSPIQIFSSGIQGVVCGRNHSFFRKNDGSLWAAGWNIHGQLGDGTTTDRSSPVEIFSEGYFGVAAGAHHSLFQKNDGSLHAVGLNSSGQLGDGTTIKRTSPVQILASGVTQVSAHWDHSFFLKDDDSIWSMGYGGYGALGDGTATSSSSPVQM